jgi:hypothetical protein
MVENYADPAGAEAFFDDVAIYRGVASPAPGTIFLPILGRGWVRWSGPLPTPIPTPTPTQEPAGVHGRVTMAGVPAVGITLTLRSYGGGQPQAVVASTEVTDPDGRYHFTGVPSAPDGRIYYVRFGSNVGNSSLVNSWYGMDIPGYRAGTTVSGGDFDVGNVPIVWPTAGATSRPPVLFRWVMRPVEDTYRVIIFDPDSDEIWYTPDLGRVDRITIALPEGAKIGHEYGWLVEPRMTADSFGYSFYTRRFTFGATQSDRVGGWNLSSPAQRSMAEKVLSDELRSRPEEEPAASHAPASR